MAVYYTHAWMHPCIYPKGALSSKSLVKIKIQRQNNNSKSPNEMAKMSMSNKKIAK